MSDPRNIRLTLAYDGTNYCGWQVQANGPSVQAALERAIERVTGVKSAVFSAGRTDSGVHALGQVANFHTTFPIPAENFRSAIQTKLPRDILILDSREVPPEFHATFKAKQKHYRYVIDNSPLPLPFFQRYSWHLRRRLDAELMHSAAQLLLGTHDFRSFETDWPNKVTSVRTVNGISVTRQPMWALWQVPEMRSAEFGIRSDASASNSELPTPHSELRTPNSPNDSLICLDITADGFLYNMVRSIVGTLVNVGRAKWTSEDVVRILQAQKRSVAGSTAPACGLYLVEATYD